MTHRPTAAALERSCHFEQYEIRALLTAQSLLAVADFARQADIDALGSPSNQAWYTAHAQRIRDLYGFDGRGQTIAIIDSGIAWDHYALGGGFGPGHRVVGGWDFAENDPIPYDDGPAGFHGTHVAGIVGSQHALHAGVAPGVDLVALRVFNDQGQGQMEWVRQALRWVSDHRLSFAHPITAVNLSLGADWNGSAPPQWATLETELANLRAQGVFISVAAGNAFQHYQAVGLSYPAASSFVVPVASHGASGSLSSFSQRHERVLVAPGESIKSTVPNHLFGGTQTNQFLGASGTSMAAPYVAGASALLRQAYEFMGNPPVNQQTIYQKLKQTADPFYDSTTAAWYHRVNLERAVASIVVDTHGDTSSTAFQLGSVHHGQVIKGTIGTRQDIDWFSFTATVSGQLRLRAETTHELQAVVQAQGGNAQWDGQTLVMNVVAGQAYQFSVATSSGIGHFQFRAEYSAPGLTAIPWGKLFFHHQSVAINGQQAFQLVAGRNGLMTVAAQLHSGNMTVELLDGNWQVVATSQSQGNTLRLDAQVVKDQTYILRVHGTGSAHFQVANLVQLAGQRLTIHGTTKADLIEFQSGGNHTVTLNGIRYEFTASQIRQVMIHGHGGSDSLVVKLGDSDDQVGMRPNQVTVVNDQVELRGRELRSIKVEAGSGSNTLRLIGSPHEDRFFGAGLTAALSGAGYANYGYQFSTVSVNGRDGFDTIDLRQSRALDRVAAMGQKLEFVRGNQQVTIYNMEHLHVPGSTPGNNAASSAQSVAGQWSSAQMTAYVFQTTQPMAQRMFAITLLDHAPTMVTVNRTEYSPLIESVVHRSSTVDDSAYLRRVTACLEAAERSVRESIDAAAILGSDDDALAAVDSILSQPIR